MAHGEQALTCAAAASSGGGGCVRVRHDADALAWSSAPDARGSSELGARVTAMHETLALTLLLQVSGAVAQRDPREWRNIRNCGKRNAGLVTSYSARLNAANVRAGGWGTDVEAGTAEGKGGEEAYRAQFGHVPAEVLGHSHHLIDYALDLLRTHINVSGL